MLEGTSFNQPQSHLACPQPTTLTTLQHQIASLIVEERQAEQRVAQAQLQSVLNYARLQIDEANTRQHVVEEKLAQANQRIGYLEALIDEMHAEPPLSKAAAIRVAFTTLATNPPSNDGVEDTTHLFMARWIPLINEIGSTVITPNALWSASVVDTVIQMCLHNVLQYKARLGVQDETIQYLLAHPPSYGEN